MGVPNENRKELLKKTFYIKGVLERAGLKIRQESANSGTQYIHIVDKGSTIRVSDHTTHRDCAFDINPYSQTIEEVLMEIFLRYKLTAPKWMGSISWGHLNKLKWRQVKDAQKLMEGSGCISLLGDQPVRRAVDKLPKKKDIKRTEPRISQEEGLSFEIGVPMGSLI